jgi:hypothetical protein
MTIRRLLTHLPLFVLALMPTTPTTPLLAQATPAPSPLVGRIGDRGFLQVESPSFARLPPRQQLLAYHLSRAAIQLDPVFYDQMSSYGLTAKRLLGALAEKPERLPAGTRQAIV